MEIAIIALIIIGLVAGIVIGYLLEQIKDLKLRLEEQRRETQSILNDKAKASAAQRSTIKGQLAEQFWPLSNDCPYVLSDMRFMGMPIDYICFDGYTECKDNQHDRIDRVVFIDVKTGNAQLSRHQKLIKDAVEHGRVVWETIRI